MSNNILIRFASFIAHIINGDDNRQSSDVVEFKTWQLHLSITNLLCYPEHLSSYKSKTYKDTPEYLYCLVGHKMAIDQSPDVSVARYFEHVFEYQIKRKKPHVKTPSDKLIQLLQEHRLCHVANDEYLRQETTSLWQILKDAGSSINGETVTYRRFYGDDFIALCQYVSDVLRTANRHYGEIFRMGLYPPDWIDYINVSQARKINKLLAPRRKANYENLKWLEEARQLWPQYAIGKLEDKNLSSFDDFLATDIGRCLTGHHAVKPIVIYDDELATQDDEHQDEYELQDFNGIKLRKLAQFLTSSDGAIVDAQDREMILQVINGAELNLDALAVQKRCRVLNLDKNSYLDHLERVIFECLQQIDGDAQ